jgi:hypothetical protein
MLPEIFAIIFLQLGVLYINLLISNAIYRHFFRGVQYFPQGIFFGVFFAGMIRSTAMSTGQEAGQRLQELRSIEKKILKRLHDLEASVPKELHYIEEAILEGFSSIEEQLLKDLRDIEDEILRELHTIEEIMINEWHIIEQTKLDKNHILQELREIAEIKQWWKDALQGWSDRKKEEDRKNRSLSEYYTLKKKLGETYNKIAAHRRLLADRET